MFSYMHYIVSTLCEMKNEMKWAVKCLYGKSKDFMHDGKRPGCLAFCSFASEVSSKSHPPSKFITLQQLNHAPET